MKKYMKPEMLPILLSDEQDLLAGSPPLGDDYTGGEVLAPEYNQEMGSPLDEIPANPLPDVYDILMP